MPVSKIRWLARCEPDNAARTTGVVLPHDWLTWHIGGQSFEPVTDRGDASGTCYFDASANAYRSDLIELGIGHDLAVPRVAAPQEIVGTTPDGVALAPERRQHGRWIGSWAHPWVGCCLAGHERHRVHTDR
jgi:xylulokinase